MIRSFFLYLVILSCTSCFLQKPYRIETFSFEKEGVPHSYSLVVPRGYDKKITTVDHAGNHIITYSYKSGAIFYMAHMQDTSVAMQPLDVLENIPRISHHTGAVIYKGRDDSWRYWREVRQNNFKSGYRFVEPDDEEKFDSATNYLVVWPVKNINER